jgi:microcystin-dependent protein
MTVETATYVADLQSANPPGTDPRSEGDNHLRLIKLVLQNTFGGASRQWQVPGVKAIATNYSAAKADGESIIYVSTASGAVTVTLPNTLVAGDAGWKVRFIKTTSDVNPIFIAPFTGTLNSGGIAGLSKARRCIPGVKVEAVWDGAAWFVTRANALPIGCCIEFHGTALPAGYEWPNGQTLSSALNYPEYNVAAGGLGTLDKRGRLGVPLDNLGGAAAGRLSGGFITGTAVGNVGGVDGASITVAQLPAHQHGVFLHEVAHSHTYSISGAVYTAAGGGTANATTESPTSTGSSSTGITIGSVSGVANDNRTNDGSTLGLTGSSRSNLQPSMMVSQILVVE